MRLAKNTELTCQQESVFKKVQQSIGDKPIYVNTAEAEVRAFCERMEDLAQQIITWFEDSGIEIFLSKKHITDLSTVGYSLSSGICRYAITTIILQNGDRSVTIMPEQVIRGRRRGV